jgi:hypothetical protein
VIAARDEPPGPEGGRGRGLVREKTAHEGSGAANWRGRISWPPLALGPCGRIDADCVG